MIAFLQKKTALFYLTSSLSQLLTLSQISFLFYITFKQINLAVFVIVIAVVVDVDVVVVVVVAAAISKTA